MIARPQEVFVWFWLGVLLYRILIEVQRDWERDLQDSVLRPQGSSPGLWHWLREEERVFPDRALFVF